MNTKAIATVVAGTVLAGGGSLVADNQINPYKTIGTDLAIVATSSISDRIQTLADTTQPKVTFSRWDGQVSMGVALEGLKANGSRPFLSKNVAWGSGKETMDAVPLSATTSMEDGGMEININLASAPSTNVFDFSLSGWEDLDFFYQAALNVASTTCTPTDCGNEHRPENVVGSYAVYYKDHSGHIEGQTNYATGKAFQIFRPEVSDAKGNTTWAALSYDDAGTLSVTVPQKFLDSATYPVVVDPTFGYTSLGASVLGGTPEVTGGEFAVSEIAYVSKITAGVAEGSGGPTNMKALIFDSDGVSGAPSTLLGITNTNVGTFPTSFQDFTFSSSLEITSSNVWMGIVDSASSGFTGGLAEDSTAGYTMHRDTSYSYSSPGNYTITGTYTSKRASIYATYTVAAAPTVTTNSASSITTTTATLNGDITDTGTATPTVRGFAWGTVSTLSGGDTATTSESGSFSTGAFTYAASSLTCNTTYYFRAYATNSVGDGLGGIDNFTTSECPVSVSSEVLFSGGKTVINGKLIVP